jgi:hypothetical protein
VPRRFWIVLGAIAAVVLVVQLAGPHATAWHFFELAVDLLLGSGPEGDRSGLRLYGDHPELQFGPTSILVALPFTLLGGVSGELLAMAFMSLLGIGVVWMMLDIVDDVGNRPGSAPAVRHWVVAVALIVTWGDIAVRTAHIDDAIAITALVAGLHGTRHDRPVAATLLFALAAAAKPWAVVFVPLCALPWRPGSWLRPALAASIAVATWIPFIVAEPDTLDTSGFGILNDPTSSLRALGIDAATTPGWVRPVQLVGGLVLVSFLVLRDRWPAAILAGISLRLLLDPGVHRYYTAGFVVGAVLVEDRIRPGRAPWFTITGALVLEITAMPGAPVLIGQATRLGVLVVALVAALGHPALSPAASRACARR